MPKTTDKRPEKGKTLDSTDNPDEEEDDIFADKEELLREKYDELWKEASDTMDDISKLQNELVLTDMLIEEAEVGNKELLIYAEKKKAKPLITMSDYHQHQVDQLIHEREVMLKGYRHREEGLNEVLDKEEKTLHSLNEELAGMNELRVIRQQQEKEIEELEKEGRQARADMADKLTQIRVQLQKERDGLKEQGRELIARTNEEARRKATELVIRKSEQVLNENNQKRKRIKELIENHRAKETQRVLLRKTNAELQQNEIYAADLDFLEYRRLNGLKDALELQKRENPSDS